MAERYAAEAAALEPEAQDRWNKFARWEADNRLHRVYSMEVPLHPSDLIRLATRFNAAQVLDVLLEMENYSPLLSGKNASAYLTAHNWLTRREREAQPK